MSDSFLTIDLGNSGCKLRLWERPAAPQPRLLEAAAIATGPELAGALEGTLSAWASEQKLAGAALSSVAASSVTAAVANVLRTLFSADFLDSPDSGLRNACEAPDAVGRDRLFAARGALELLRESAVVVDAGTAVTVDALRVDAAGAGVFEGGAIAPGPALLAAALGAGAARLPDLAPVPGAPALGRSTTAALRAGISSGFRGAARELVERVAAEAELGGAPVALTGGARAFLLQPHPFTERRLVVEENLVHLGLLRAVFAGRG